MAEGVTNLNTPPPPDQKVVDVEQGALGRLAEKWRAWFTALGEVLNWHVTGDLTVDGDATVTGTLAADGDATVTGTLAAGLGGILGSNPLLFVRDQKANNTAGGASVALTWNVRTLNTAVVNQITGASLAANQMLLPNGTYWVEARAPARSVDRHKLKIFNVPDAVDEIIGQDAHVSNAVSVTTPAPLSGLLTVTGAAPTKAYELQHYTQTGVAVSGLGLETNAGVIEVYAEARIWKLA